jgi:hypothetical protein
VSTLNRKTGRKQYVKREYIALKEEIHKKINDGWTIVDTYRELKESGRIRMSYEALCQCINGKYDAMNLKGQRASELAVQSKAPATKNSREKHPGAFFNKPKAADGDEGL